MLESLILRYLKKNENIQEVLTYIDVDTFCIKGTSLRISDVLLLIANGNNLDKITHDHDIEEDVLSSFFLCLSTTIETIFIKDS